MSLALQPYSRYRETGSTTRDNVTNYHYTCNGTQSVNNVFPAHRAGVVEGCHDVVTPGFHTRVQRGEIINNPFLKVKQTFGGGGTGGGTRSNPCTIPASTSGVDWDVSMRYYNSAFVFDEYRIDGKLHSFPSVIDVDALVTLASTSALAGVDTPSAEGLVALAELRQTLAMLRNPLSSMLRLTENWAKSKRLDKAIARTAVEGPRAFADQYLTYYYGMRPLVKDLEDILKGYLREGSTPSRVTSRGYATDSETTVSVTGGPSGVAVGRSWYTNQVTRSDTVSVRSGVLYVPTENTYQKVLGLRFSDLPSAVYEATPWSFLIDYASNLGDVVKALTPRIGVDYLASWTTVRSLIEIEARTIGNGVIAGGPPYGTRVGSEYATVRHEATLRIPKSPYGNVGISLDFHPELWASAKITAVSCLALQQLHAKVGAKFKGSMLNYLHTH